MSADKKSGGLAGVVAGETAICTVGKEGMGLTYRGYSINDLAEKATFEEVAFLLLYRHLPNRTELENYRKKLGRSEEHTSELQSRFDLVCRLLLEKKKKNTNDHIIKYYH